MLPPPFAVCCWWDGVVDPPLLLLLCGDTPFLGLVIGEVDVTIRSGTWREDDPPPAALGMVGVVALVASATRKGLGVEGPSLGT